MILVKRGGSHRLAHVYATLCACFVKVHAIKVTDSRQCCFQLNTSAKIFMNIERVLTDVMLKESQ